MRQPLGYIDLTNWKGLATKTTPGLTDDAQLDVAINTDHFEEYGGITKPPGMSRVLSAIYTEGGVAQPISWLGLYKAADLNGQILRHVLVAAGTKILRIESDGSLTALTGTGFSVTETRTAGLFHTAATFDDMILIQNQDPDLVGRGNLPIKYDGNDVLRWGIVAPGETETVREAFDSSASFTTSGVTVAAETTTTQDGAAVRVNKTSLVQVNGDISKSVTAFAIDNTIPNRARVWLYIPRGGLAKLSQGSTKAVEIRIGLDLTTNYYDITKDRGALVEGWNPINLNFYGLLSNDPDETVDDPEVSVTGTPGTSALTAIRFRINTVLATDTISGIVWDRFATFDVGAPTVTESVVGADADPSFAVDSVYRYKVLFRGKNGHRSNAGPESAFLQMNSARDQIDLTNVPVSTDPQVVARDIYRTVNGGEIFLFVDSIENNTTTTFTDTTEDIGLGQTSPPLEGDVSDDNTPPPQAGIVRRWQRTIFLAGMPDRPEVVIWSDDDEPESFPTLNESRLDAKITAIYETYSGLVIETELGKWQVTGDNPDFVFNKVITGIGCVGRRAAGETRVAGWSVDRDGMRLYDLNNPVKISEVIRDKFDDNFNKTNIELLHSTHSKRRNCILMFVANSSGDYTGNNFVYQYPLDQVGAGWWWELQLPTTINPQHVAEIEDTDGNFHLYMGGDDGMVYELFDEDSKNWVRADGQTEAITTTFTTKYIRLGSTEEVQNAQGHSGRVLPRFLELRWDGDVPASWTVTVSTAEGDDQDTPTDTQTVTLNFTSTIGKSSLLRVPIPMMQAGEFVKISGSNSELNVAGSVTGLRLYYHIFPGAFPNESA